MFSGGTAEGISVATAEVSGANFSNPGWVAPGPVEFFRSMKHCRIKQEIKEEQGGGRTRLSIMVGVRVSKKLFVKVHFVGREKKKSCGEMRVEERELTRTSVHVSDLGHVPFREV